MPIAHIFKYGKIRTTAQNCCPAGTIENGFVSMQNNGFNKFHPVPFRTGVG